MKPLEAQSGAELVHQVNRRLGRLAWIASAVGAIFVFNSIGFLIPIFLDPDERTRLALTNAPAIIAYLAVFGFLIRRHTARHLQETLRWIVEDREPDEREHRRTLNLALYGVKFALLGWIAAIPLFAALSVATQSWGWGAVVGATVWCGAETTCD